jgi:hypothetical protein
MIQKISNWEINFIGRYFRRKPKVRVSCFNYENSVYYKFSDGRMLVFRKINEKRLKERLFGNFSFARDP